MSDPQQPSGPARPGGRERAADAGRATARGLRTGARSTARAAAAVGHQARRAAGAQGAEASGLNRLIYLHAANAAGDAAVAIALAGSLFFQVPSGEARGQVTLFLGLTMLPFAIVAPLIGPTLDRFSHGRRWAIGATMAVRAFLAWVLAGAVGEESPELFGAALGVLVASKAYGVTRAAAVPRLRPPALTLVRANGRVSLAGMVGAGVSAPLAFLASLAGSDWALRYAFVLFVVAVVLAIRLPERVDSSAGEQPMVLLASPEDRSVEGQADGKAPAGGRRGRRGLSFGVPRSVAFALLANAGPRFTTGFLIMFMAFLLRENPPTSALSDELLVALVVGAAGLGNGLGVAAASLLRRLDPRVTVIGAVVADLAALLLATLFYGVLPLVLLGLVAGLAQSLAKFCLDATIQADVPPTVAASAFARSDTTLQLAWVVGGFVGVALPLDPARLGLGVAAAVMVSFTAFVLSRARAARG
ncbi:MFS transporter [Nocardioides bruguierae]|uniref:MFS transporter n=1 Tax=Nocardioides bruguierae TaxID=2945102 RepID=UPI0020216858|nr:MFS transporter [Nocardioides bruguierae]MCL8024176.1 MFS transporter [Nocardioides bruguierae]